MSNQKVLIITYYWPPAGGPGVQRWLKFTKYLPEFGVWPYVYVPENPSYPILDESLVNDISKEVTVVKYPIWEPYQIAEKLNPKNKEFKAGQFKQTGKQGFLSKLSVYIRGNFFIPDARRFWVNPSVKFLNKYLKKNQIDTIVTSGPPHSLHLIGLGLKNLNPKLNWIADFRDPWTTISYHSSLQLTEKSRKRHLKLEKEVMTKSDLVLATSFSDAENYRSIGAGRVEVITNGFEPIVHKPKPANQKFSLVYSGGLEALRNPVPVWKVLSELIQDKSFANDFRFDFYGKIGEEVEASIQDYGLKNHFVNHGYLDYELVREKISEASLLLLVNFDNPGSKGIIPGKLFEYMATGVPVVALGPNEADVEKIIQETKSGEYFDFRSQERLKNYILEQYERWKKGITHQKNENISQYSRKEITKKLARLLK